MILRSFGKFFGLAGLRVGYFVAPWARGRGAGSLALWLVCDWAFRAGGCEVVTWNALVGNVPSRRMVEKVGFHVHADPARRIKPHQYMPIKTNQRVQEFRWMTC